MNQKHSLIGISVLLPWLVTLSTGYSPLPLFMGGGSSISHNNNDTNTVIVIGAGLSGLAVSLELEAQGFRVVVLEANDWIGGRVKSSPYRNEDDDAIELGGTYLHGASDRNSLWWYCQQHSIATIATGGTSETGGGNHTFWTTNTTTTTAATTTTDQNPFSLDRTLFDTWFSHMVDGIRHQHHGQNNTHNNWTWQETPLRLREMSRWAMDQMKLEDGDMDQKQTSSTTRTRRRLLERQIQSSFDQDLGVSFDQVDPLGYMNDWEWEYYGDDSDHVFAKGTRALIDSLVSKLQRPVWLETPVTRIVHRSSSSSDGNGCWVETANRTSLYGSACVVTIPLGVLKAQHSTLFDPPLNADKQDALERAGIATLNTVLVEWNQNLCRNGSHTVLPPPGQDDAHWHLRQYVCPGLWRRSLTNITQFYLQGHDHPFDNETYWKEQAVLVMKTIYPHIGMDDIVGVTATSWHKDPYFLGSYSAPTTRTHGNRDREILAHPTGKSLYFAGEHTHAAGRYQSMDGAYDTGIRAATQLCQDRQKKQPPVYANPHESARKKRTMSGTELPPKIPSVGSNLGIPELVSRTSSA